MSTLQSLLAAIVFAVAPAGTVEEPAERGPQRYIAENGLDPCDVMRWHADNAGLPDDFDWIGYEESRCRNDVTNQFGQPCCHGYFQIHQGWIRWAPERAAQCGVDEVSDFKGATAPQRAKNACMARIVFDIQGICAWQVVRC